MDQVNRSTSDTSLRKRFPWRRLLWYRLRTLLIVTAIIAVWLGWWSYKARQQREAVEALRRTGFGFTYDYQLQKLNRPAYWPVWLIDKLGIDYFANITGISHNSLDASDADLIQLSAIDIPSVERADLDMTKISDAGLLHLSRFRWLKHVGLSYTQIGDVGVAHLSGLNRMETISLGGTYVTDTGVESLQGMKGLRSLDLSATVVTDASLTHIKKLAMLQMLWLTNTKVTDDGLALLSNMNTLRFLGLENTQVTAAGVARLQKALPNCSIAH
ncbi:MAG: hypothetical protein K8T25_03030 [Planctomycetia bacterium]|nr:hypothetical protein [Planctomycetia bacterium]